VSPAATRELTLPADPRPVIVADGDRHVLEGARCVACGHPLALRPPRCTRCGAETAPARFGPLGTIWSSTVVHVAARPGDALPYTLAYVDLDDGPRLLTHVGGEAGGAHVGARVELAATAATGDPMVELTP
jgi:uncharacterized protein